MTAFLSHCRPRPSMHYLIGLFSYNNCAFLPRASGGFPLFQGKASRESAPFPTRRCPQPDAAGPRLSLNSQGRRPAKADLLKTGSCPPWQLWPEESPVQRPGMPCSVFPQQMWGGGQAPPRVDGCRGWELLLHVPSCTGTADLCCF